MRRVLVVLIVLMAASGAAAPQDGPPAADAPPDGPGALAPAPARFAGLWRYNEAHSIDTATGEPERGARGPAGPRVQPIERPRVMAGAGGLDEVLSDSPFAPSPRAMREHRDMVRDLMEIAETLEFLVGEDAVTMTDDLGRERTYPTDDRPRAYRLGASEFRARTRWEGNRLHRTIEGTFGFRMTETYFLSPEADRLFIIMRVDAVSRGRPPLGADRVYDRVDPEDQ